MRAILDFLVDLAFVLAALVLIAFLTKRGPWQPAPAASISAGPAAERAEAIPASIAAPAAGSRPRAPVRRAPAEIVRPAPTPGGEYITGTVAYPGERDVSTAGIEVCAQSLETGRTRCAKELIYGKNGSVGYHIAVAPGSYLVYAREAFEGGFKKAYYTEFAECYVKRSGCKSSSHSAIPAVVGDGQRISGIDPVDWDGKP